MKVFVGYFCNSCRINFDVDSRNLSSHTEPKCPKCGCDDAVERVYIDEDEEE